MTVAVEEKARLADWAVVSTAEPLRYSTNTFVFVWPLVHFFASPARADTARIGDLHHSAMAIAHIASPDKGARSQIVERLQRLSERILERRGGKPLPDSTRFIRAERDRMADGEGP